jgi:hypothetical protein
VPRESTSTRGEYGLTLTVDVRVNPSIEFINTRSEFFGVEIEGSFIGGNKMVECTIENAKDFRRFVVHDGVEFLIPEKGNGKSGSKWV